MNNRLILAFSSIFEFLKDPVKQWDSSNDQYRDLFDIATLIMMILSVASVLTDTSYYGKEWWEYSIILILVLGLARVFAWLLLNFNSVVFDYYMNKFVSPRLIDLHPNLLLNQRILVYASVTTLIVLFPIDYSHYLIILIHTILCGYGIATYYQVELGKSLFISAIFNVAWNGIIYLALTLLARSHKRDVTWRIDACAN